MNTEIQEKNSKYPRKMSFCKISSSTSKAPFHFFPNSNHPNKTLVTEDVSFRFQVPKLRISIRNPSRSGRRARHAARIRAFYAPKVGSQESLYEHLGIPETGSTLSDIKKAYKMIARKYHPDVSPQDRVDENTRRFIMVTEAYETLSNPQTRALYDRDLANGSGSSFSARRPNQYNDQRMAEAGEWIQRWQAQLEDLKRRSMNPSSARMSWGARMRAQRRTN
ncbi:hypothetical protein CDL12_01080 [Handroanthus impetiginosus]|uniref:J domain-containing protein n=1 Tax=Handroanthus impetiginosus TaxID=429701 RepID=A0A2G9I8U4_9LAMI|nr:hypothetical protein CDL12_01080 [Handroanthus impetiginosus]